MISVIAIWISVKIIDHLPRYQRTIAQQWVMWRSLEQFCLSCLPFFELILHHAAFEVEFVHAAAATTNIWMFPQSPAKPVRIQYPQYFMKRKHCEAGYFFISITLVIASLWFTGDKSQGLLFSAYKTSRQCKTGAMQNVKLEAGSSGDLLSDGIGLSCCHKSR